MGNEGSEDHGIIRSDFPGGWPSDNDKNAFTGHGLTDDERWAQQRVKGLLQLRRSHPLQFKGLLKHFAPENGVYTYIREANVDSASGADKSNTNQSDKILVILNKKPVDLPLNKYAEVLSTHQTLTRVSDGISFKTTATLSLQAMSASVFIVQ